MERLLESPSVPSLAALASQNEAPVVPLIPNPETALIMQNGSVSSVDDVNTTASQSPPAGRSFSEVFTSTFLTIFLAEIGDKTQVSTLLMSAEFHKPWVVFLGAGTALVATTLIGVWIGQWLSSRLSPRTLDIAAGIMLALISVSLLWDVVQMTM
ncbi:MAG: TMEM165/GDT1 family protein [Leptolyngbyaceae cyanobacterium bins.349]|nr:TMEM165/GDT1 family protein [Leptolyngbyaceae cyanobacterium bins.349]